MKRIVIYGIFTFIFTKNIKSYLFGIIKNIYFLRVKTLSHHVALSNTSEKDMEELYTKSRNHEKYNLFLTLRISVKTNSNLNLLPITMTSCLFPKLSLIFKLKDKVYLLEERFQKLTSLIDLMPPIFCRAFQKYYLKVNHMKI